MRSTRPIRLKGLACRIYMKSYELPEIDLVNPRLVLNVDGLEIVARLTHRDAERLRQWDGAFILHMIIRLDGWPRMESCQVQFLESRHRPLVPHGPQPTVNGPDAIPIRQSEDIERGRQSSLPLQPAWPKPLTDNGEQ